MKFFHIADLHLGKIVNGFSLIEDQAYALDQILKTAEKEKPIGIFLSGDIYDRAIPPKEAVDLLNKFLTELKKKNITVLLICGNHDSPSRVCFACDILKDDNIYLSGEWKKELEKVRFEEKKTAPVNVYLMPYAKLSVMNEVLGKQYHKYQDCIQEVIRQIPFEKDEISILLTHHFVLHGSQCPDTCDSEIDCAVGGMEGIDASVFEPFDYVALGHLHGPQWIGGKKIRYAGSLLKYSFSEVFHHKSITVLDVQENRLTVTVRELVPLHDMRKIKGSLKELLREDIVQKENAQDYLHITLTDTEELYNPIGSLRGVYPNVMQLVLEKNKKEEEREINAAEDIKKKTTLELYQDFYQEVTNMEFDIERKKIMEEIFKEILEPNL